MKTSHEQRQRPMALVCCDDVMGGSPPGARASRPHTSWHSLAPSPPPGSSGSGARTLLRPGPCRSRRQGGRVRHRREPEQHATAQHAGGTPALPGGRRFPTLLLLEGACAGLPGRSPCRCGTAVTIGGASCRFVDFSFLLVSGWATQAPALLAGAVPETACQGPEPLGKIPPTDGNPRIPRAGESIRMRACSSEG